MVSGFVISFFVQAILLALLANNMYKKIGKDTYNKIRWQLIGIYLLGMSLAFVTIIIVASNIAK